MSTYPHNAPDAGTVDRPAVVSPPATARELDAAIRHFEATADALGAPRPASDELAKMVYQVATITRELFPGKLVVETDVDPECRDDVCLLFQVEATGSVEQIVTLNDRWHRHLLPLAPKWPLLFCLSIDAR